MLTPTEVQDEVRRIGTEVLKHNHVHPDQVGRAITALNDLVVALYPIVAEHEDLVSLEQAFNPSGQSNRADDPNCTWVRFEKADYSKMLAAKAALHERRHRARIDDELKPVQS